MRGVSMSALRAQQARRAAKSRKRNPTMIVDGAGVKKVQAALAARRKP